MYNNCVREQVSITTRDVVIVVTSGLVILKVCYLIKLDFWYVFLSNMSMIKTILPCLCIEACYTNSITHALPI